MARDDREVQPKTIEMARRCVGLVAPPPALTVSQWADERRILPRSAAEPGRWRTDRTPYLRAPMDACCDPRTRKVVLIFASQTGKSETLLNIAGYFIDYDPAAMLMIQPTVELAEAFSKERLAPMLADTPSLAERVADPRSRDTGNTILRKEYPGGYLVLIGANAPSGLASRPIRILLADEVDRFPISAGTEGDPLSLAEKRTTTFWNALEVVVSTPTIKGASRIESEYESSSREEWCVPCPACGEAQPYEWARLVFRPEGDEAPAMACRGCGVLSGEYEWKASPGQWVAFGEHSSTRGFRMNALASPWLSWPELIAEFHEARAKGPETLKTFVNTRLAESWEEAGEALDEELLASRRHYYNCDVPDDVTWLTAGVDVQQDRLEVEVVGWGPGKQSWGIEYGVIPGDPHREAVWIELDEFIQRTYRLADDTLLPISCVAVDSGYATTEVYRWTRARLARYVFAVKGQGGPGQPVVGSAKKHGKNRDVFVFPVGTDAAKDLLLTRLMVDSEGPGYCHFPREDRLSDGGLRGYGEDYFRGLMAERRVERHSAGRLYHVWIKRSSHSRNEPLDCRVYATAALEIRNPDLARTGGTRTERRPAAAALPRRRLISRGIG